MTNAECVPISLAVDYFSFEGSLHWLQLPEKHVHLCSDIEQGALVNQIRQVSLVDEVLANAELLAVCIAVLLVQVYPSTTDNSCCLALACGHADPGTGNSSIVEHTTADVGPQQPVFSPTGRTSGLLSTVVAGSLNKLHSCKALAININTLTTTTGSIRHVVVRQSLQAGNLHRRFQF
jgi:hypothetical protein